MLGRQNAGRVRLEEVEKDLGYYILKNSTSLLLMRDYSQTSDVVESAKKNTDANIVLDALMLEKKLFKNIWGDKSPALTYNTEVVNRINIMMSEVGMKIEALSLPTLVGDAKYYGTVRTREEMISRLEAVLYDTYGDELKRHFFRSIIMDEISNRVNRDSVNIVLINVVPNMVRAFSSYAGSTQVLSDEGVLPNVRPTAATASYKEEAAPIQPTSPRTEQHTPKLNTLMPDQVPTAPKPYTGKKRGRKTDAERAARAAMQSTNQQNNQNEG